MERLAAFHAETAFSDLHEMALSTSPPSPLSAAKLLSTEKGLAERGWRISRRRGPKAPASLENLSPPPAEPLHLEEPTRRGRGQGWGFLKGPAFFFHGLLISRSILITWMEY